MKKENQAKSLIQHIFLLIFEMRGLEIILILSLILCGINCEPYTTCLHDCRYLYYYVYFDEIVVKVYVKMENVNVIMVIAD